MCVSGQIGLTAVCVSGQIGLTAVCLDGCVFGRLCVWSCARARARTALCLVLPYYYQLLNNAIADSIPKCFTNLLLKPTAPCYMKYGDTNVTKIGSLLLEAGGLLKF